MGRFQGVIIWGAAMLKTRLETVEKALGLLKGTRPKHFWLFISRTPREAAATVKKIKAGRIPSVQGGIYSPDNDNRILDICPVPKTAKK